MTDALLRGLVGEAPAPVLATCRPLWEGGGFRGPEAERRRVLERALAAGAALVDVEVEAPWAAEMLARARDRIVLSHHTQETAETRLLAVAGRLAEARPAVAKLVVAANTLATAVPLRRADELLRAAGVARSCFCMGEAARATRLLAAANGAALVYAAADVGGGTAAGQWPLRILRDDLRLPRWRRQMQRYGLVGEPIGHSLSPAIFNAAFAERDEPALYLPLAGGPFAEVLAVAEAWGLCGLSVTMPYKQEAAAACRELSAPARRIGAVNTLTRRADGWHGDNTDGAAVRQVLERRVQLRGARVAILGAGGAARAAAVALLEAGASVCLLNRSEWRARRVAAELGCDAGPLQRLRRERWRIVVNATPVGLGSDDRTPVPGAWLRGGELLLEMNYRPRRTRWLREAAPLGCFVVEGIEMFLAQAAGQYRIWRGGEPPFETMSAVATARLRDEAERLGEAGR